MGGAGNDTMFGNAQGNVLKGGRGLDILVGSVGADRLSGGAGADGFIFVAGDGRDVVTDFTKSVDVISLGSDLWGGSALTGAQVLTRFASIQAGNLVFDFGTDELTLQHVSSLAGMVDRIVIS